MSEMFDVEKFKGAALRRSLLSTNKFLVTIPVPLGLRSQKFNTAKDRFQVYSVGNNLKMWCKSATLPGVQFATSQARPLGYGPFQKQPHTPMFQDLQTLFYVDGGGTVIDYFALWAKLISNFDTRSGGAAAPATGILTNQYPYEVAYADQYMVDITVEVFANNGKRNDDSSGPVAVHTYKDAWPVVVGEVRLDWEQRKQVMTLPVTFSYFDWYPEPLFVNSLNVG